MQDLMRAVIDLDSNEVPNALRMVTLLLALQALGFDLPLSDSGRAELIARAQGHNVSFYDKLVELSPSYDDLRLLFDFVMKISPVTE